MVMSPEMGTAVGHALDRVNFALAPYSAGRSSPNIADRPMAANDRSPPDVYTRLKDVREQYDPSAMFLSGHPIE
jgi:hypothetical protein